jgi:hypothetical protein
MERQSGRRRRRRRSASRSEALAWLTLLFGLARGIYRWLTLLVILAVILLLGLGAPVSPLDMLLRFWSRL